MIQAGQALGIEYPWRNPQPWRDFWGNSLRATGQLPAEVFLWYVVFRLVAHHPETIDKILNAPSTKAHYDRKTASLLDVICERFLFERDFAPDKRLLPSLSNLQEQFEDFEDWLVAILTRFHKLSSNAHRKVVLACALGAHVAGPPGDASEGFWRLLTLLLQGDDDQQARVLGSAVRLGGRGKWSTLEAHVIALVRSFKAGEKTPLKK
jgi:hypothetical protein